MTDAEAQVRLRAHVEAMCRLLVADGHMTPVATRQILSVLDAETHPEGDLMNGTTSQFPATLVTDLAIVIDGWYGCAAQAVCFIAQEIVAAPAPLDLDVAVAAARVRYEAAPARTTGSWSDEMEPGEAMDAALQAVRDLTEGGEAAIGDLFDAVGGHPDMGVPTHDYAVTARLIGAAVEYLQQRQG